MNRSLPIVGALLVACAAAHLAFAQTAEDVVQASANEGFRWLYRYSLQDPHNGQLYGPSAALLSTLRDMPESIDLAGEEEAGAPPDVAQPKPKEPAEAVAQREPVEEPVSQKGWVPLLDNPVVTDEELAHVYFMAGSYADAARLYRRLSEKVPGDAQLMLMLAVCERNGGSNEEAKRLLTQIGDTDAEALLWADWMTIMMQISRDSEAPQ